MITTAKFVGLAEEIIDETGLSLFRTDLHYKVELSYHNWMLFTQYYKMLYNEFKYWVLYMNKIVSILWHMWLTYDIWSAYYAYGLRLEISRPEKLLCLFACLFDAS